MAITSLLLLSTVAPATPRPVEPMVSAIGQRTRRSTPKRASSRGSARATNDAPTPPTTTLVTMREPVENAYTMGMPKGWKNLTYLARLWDSTTIVDLSVSPNGTVVLWSGDPSLPAYTVPEAATDAHHFIAQRNKKFQIAPFQTAEQYFPEYTRRKFGRMAGFKVTGVRDDPAAAKAFMERARREYGLQMFLTVAHVDFAFQSDGKTIRGIITGLSGGGMGSWNVSMSGIATTGDPKSYMAMATAIGKTRKMNPQWQAAQQQARDAALARMRSQTASMMQASAQAHQQRMAAIKASGEASTRAYYDRMASGDVQHRNFLNYINDENTMVSASGKSYQVDNSYERYFMHKRDHTYIGGGSGMTLDDLRRMGKNPDDYEQLRPRRN